MWEFTGGASSTTGIPARDLTDEEWAAIPKWLQDIALTRGFYRNVSVTVPDVVDTAPEPVEAEPQEKPALRPRKK